MSSHVLYMMWNERWLWIQWRVNVLHLELILGTPIYFAFLRWHQCSSLVVTVFLGIFFSSIRLIEVPYVFDWEHVARQHEMQWNSLMSFLDLRQAPGVYSRVTAGMAIWNSALFSEVRTPVFLWRTRREVKLFLAGKYRCFWRWAVRPSFPY